MKIALLRAEEQVTRRFLGRVFGTVFLDPQLDERIRERLVAERKEKTDLTARKQELERKKEELMDKVVEVRFIRAGYVAALWHISYVYWGPALRAGVDDLVTEAATTSSRMSVC